MFWVHLLWPESIFQKLQLKHLVPHPVDTYTPYNDIWADNGLDHQTQNWFVHSNIVQYVSLEILCLSVGAGYHSAIRCIDPEHRSGIRRPQLTQPKALKCMPKQLWSHLLIQLCLFQPIANVCLREWKLFLFVFNQIYRNHLRLHMTIYS